MPVRHSPHPVTSIQEVRQFFDQLARHPHDRHGPSGCLLNYRLRLIQRAAAFNPDDTVLDIGCGVGNHLLGISEYIQKGIGIDLSEEMVERARQQLRRNDPHCPLSFRVDNAETLTTIPTASIDVVLCVGAFEHMLDKQKVLQATVRVLRPRGRLICLTPNGASLWYSWLAPAFGWTSRHLSTDQFLNREQLKRMLRGTGFVRVDIDYWQFVAAGDMPGWMARLLRGIDVFGRLILPHRLRGGLLVNARKGERSG